MAKQQNGRKPVESHDSSNTKQSNGRDKQGSGQRRQRSGQPRKDSNSKRVNFDNARESKVAKRIMDDAKSGKFNDINDFLRNPMLIKAAASYPVFPIVGTPIGDAQPAPGILVFRWSPSFGAYTRGGTRTFGLGTPQLELTVPPVALNQAADSTYSFIVHANSRNYSYNSSDLMMLILAGSQVFSIISAMIRAYGLAKRYVETSRYMPNTLLYALGFDPDNLRNNLGQAWFDLNNLITQTRQIWVPSVFPIVSRWMDLNQHVYKDAPGEYAQTYAYVQMEYFKYDETVSKTGGCLVPANYVNGSTTTTFNPGYPGTVYPWSTWVSVAQSMIDALVNSEDRGIIYGDLLNAYTAERIIALPEINSDYMVDREYSPEISMQIENTILTGANYRLKGLFQFDNKLFPQYRPATGSGDLTAYVPRSGLLNFHMESDPTPEMILLATRFHTLGLLAAQMPEVGASLGDPDVYTAWVPDTVGSEQVTSMVMYYAPYFKGSTPANVVFNNNNYAENTTGWLRLMAFDWHPFAYQMGTSVTVPSVPTSTETKKGAVYGRKTLEFYGDFDRYGTSDDVLLRKINDAAEFSLFGVPQI